MMLAQILFLYIFIFTHGASIQADAKMDPLNSKNIFKSTNDNKHKKLLKMVEKKFLDLLGLPAKPNKKLKQKVKVPDHLWKLYYKWSDENYEDFTKNNADTARVLYHNIEKDHAARSKLTNLRFNISGVSEKESIEKVELLLFNERKSTTSSPIKKKVLKVLVSDNSTQQSTKKKIASVKKLESNKLGYINFDVTNTVRSWLNNSVSDTSMFIDAGDDYADDVHLRRRRDVSETEWHKKRPILIVYTSSSNTKQKRKEALAAKKRLHKRKKRSSKLRGRRSVYDIDYESQMRRLNETHQRSLRETCRLRPFHLDFDYVGWNEWILAPAGFGINYCSGECPKPLGPHFNTTNHAVIQNSVHSINRQLVPSLCCIPVSLRDQTLLYLDNLGKLVLKNTIQMTAASCGCR